MNIEALKRLRHFTVNETSSYGRLKSDIRQLLSSYERCADAAAKEPEPQAEEPKAESKPSVPKTKSE